MVKSCEIIKSTYKNNKELTRWILYCNAFILAPIGQFTKKKKKKKKMLPISRYLFIHKKRGCAPSVADYESFIEL